MKIAFQMDPISEVDIRADSSFRLAIEAQSRGHRLFHYTPNDIFYAEGQIKARVQEMTLKAEVGDHVTFGAPEVMDLRQMAVIWLRQDPPFDMAYITTTHLLERLKGDVLVVNDPFWVRNSPEKLMILDFPELIPPTMIASDLDQLKAFREAHHDIIIKPLYGNGGAGVFRITPQDQNLNSLHELFTAQSNEPLIAQKYLPEVVKGDKRVILVDGVPIGGINRVPKAGEVRSNMHVGGKAVASELTARELEICDAIGETLRHRGQIFVGIDVIGDYLTEINVTSPTGLQELERFSGVNGAGKIWEAIEAKIAS